MNSDPIVEELHKIREQHAAEFNYDKDRILNYWLNKAKDKKKVYVNLENVKTESNYAVLV